MPAPVERMGAVYGPIPYAAGLEAEHFPNRSRIAERVLAMAAGS